MYNVYCEWHILWHILTPKGALENLMSVHLSVYKLARAFFLTLYIYAHNRACSIRAHQQRECLSETPTPYPILISLWCGTFCSTLWRLWLVSGPGPCCVLTAGRLCAPSVGWRPVLCPPVVTTYPGRQPTPPSHQHTRYHSKPRILLQDLQTSSST